MSICASVCLAVNLFLSVSHFNVSISRSVSASVSIFVYAHLSFSLSLCLSVCLSKCVALFCFSACPSSSRCVHLCVRVCLVVFVRTPVTIVFEKCKETGIYRAVRHCSFHYVSCEQYLAHPTPLSNWPVLTCERCVQWEAWCSATVPLPQLRLHTEGRRAGLSENCRP